MKNRSLLRERNQLRRSETLKTLMEWRESPGVQRDAALMKVKVAKAKQRACSDFYDRLDSSEREKDLP